MSGPDLEFEDLISEVWDGTTAGANIGGGRWREGEDRVGSHIPPV